MGREVTFYSSRLLDNVLNFERSPQFSRLGTDGWLYTQRASRAAAAEAAVAARTQPLLLTPPEVTEFEQCV